MKKALLFASFATLVATTQAPCATMSQDLVNSWPSPDKQSVQEWFAGSPALSEFISGFDCGSILDAIRTASAPVNELAGFDGGHPWLDGLGLLVSFPESGLLPISLQWQDLELTFGCGSITLYDGDALLFEREFPVLCPELCSEQPESVEFDGGLSLVAIPEPHTGGALLATLLMPLLLQRRRSRRG